MTGDGGTFATNARNFPRCVLAALPIFSYGTNLSIKFTKHESVLGERDYAKFFFVALVHLSIILFIGMNEIFSRNSLSRMVN